MDKIRIGDLVSLDGRTFSVRGFDPMSLPEQRVELVDAATGESVRLPVTRLDTAMPSDGTSAEARRASGEES